MLFFRIKFFIILFISFHGFSQGSWNPPGADLRYPRTLLDTLQIDSVRSTLASVEILPIYNLVFNHAGADIPIGNNTDEERFTRSTIAKEAAFVALMNQKPAGSLTIPLTSEERQQFLENSKQLLEEINTEVGFQSGWIFYQEWQHRSKELINYLVAYDLLLGNGLSVSYLQQAKDSLIVLTGHLYHRAMATYNVLIWQFQFFTYQFNNHSIMTASALGLAAVVLNDHESGDPDYQPLNWINTGLWNLDNTLWRENGVYPRVSDPGMIAGYAEGPAYFAYAFENAYPFTRALWNFLPDDSLSITFNGITRQIRHPWYDPNYDSLCEWMIRTRMPDGSSPAIHDSPIGFGTAITALSGKSQYTIPTPSFPPTDVMWRTQYIATMPHQGMNSNTFMQSLPDAGSLVFRSSTDPDAIYLHFIGKHGIPLSGAKAHHQGDASSFSLMGNGELLAVDPGYPGYQESSAVNNASNHNLILVNGLGPLPPVGEAVSVETNTCWIEHSFSCKDLDYAEIRSNWFGADLTRKVLFLSRDHVLLADFISSVNPNSYTFQLHGNGLINGTTGSPEGVFSPDFTHHQGTYSRDSTHLLIHTVATGGADNYSFSTDSLATGTNQYRHYSKMLVTKENEPNTVFLSALFPYESLSPTVETLEASSTVNALLITHETSINLVFAQQTNLMTTIPPTISGLLLPVSGNGAINLATFQANASSPTSLFLQQGDTLSLGNQPYIVSAHRMNTCLYYDPILNDQIEGFVGDSGWVGIYCYSPNLWAPSVGNILAYYPDELHSLLMVRFASASNFILVHVEGSQSVDFQPLQANLQPSAAGQYRLILTGEKSFTGKINLFSITGQLLKSLPVSGIPGINEYPIDMSSRPSGLYIVSIETTEGGFALKLIH